MGKSLKEQREAAHLKLDKIYDDIEVRGGDLSLYDMEVLAEKESRDVLGLILDALAEEKKRPFSGAKSTSKISR